MAVSVGWNIVRDSFRDFFEDSAPRLAAALAYYGVFSLAPMLLIVVTIAGMIWGQQAVEGKLVEQISTVMGQEAGQQIQTMIANVQKEEKSGLMLAVGIGTLLFGALGMFSQLKGALNTIWEVQTKSPGGLRSIWIMARTYLLSFAMVLVVAFLLIVTLVASAALAAVSKWMQDVLPLPSWAMTVADLVISFAVLTMLFAAIYKILPDVRIRWKDVWLGAAVTAALFTGGKFAIGYYLGRSAAASVYGAAGSLIIILLWIYYTSLIFLLGAEFTQAYAKRWGAQIRPNELAEPMPGTALAESVAAVGKKRVAGRNEPARREESETPHRGSDRSRAYANDREPPGCR